MIQKKVCMVGVYATGKTSLVRQFVHAKFSDKYLSTVGVKIDRKPVQVGGQDVNLLLWDLEGRDGVQDIQTSYLRGAAGVIYVADGTRRETVTQVFELRELVQGAVGAVPEVLALNKVDLADQWIVTSADRANLAQVPWHTFDTSAKTGDGVEAAFQWLATAMVKSP
ncbi:MAG: GTP-binding protein [Gemmatimonadota bacterium]|nr:GTP-binding protein [Gemmatimonadota bacterium]MDH5197733.1 GTP-binding protein [Gemmatimonadota bacterium]